MKFYRLNPRGAKWMEDYESLPLEESDKLPGGVHTDFWVLVQLQDSEKILSAPEVQSRLKATEEVSYPMGAVNTSLSRLVRKGYVHKEDWE